MSEAECMCHAHSLWMEGEMPICSRWHENARFEHCGHCGHPAQCHNDEKQRTKQQQKAIEVFCKELARELNNRGLDQKKVMEAIQEGVELPWRQESVKEDIWRNMQILLLGKESTTELNPSEVSRVYDVINRFLVDRFSFSMQFPSRFVD